MSEKNYHKYLLLAVLTLILLLAVMFFSMTNDFEKVDLLFTEEVMNQANELFTNTSSDKEFFAYLKVNDGVVNNLSLMGYKNLITGKVLIANSEVLPTLYTLHNHDNGICLPSEDDLKLNCDVACIICKNNTINCYKTLQGGLEE